MERYFILLFVILCISNFGQVTAENECFSNPCINGATCVDHGNYGYYTCQCATNWMGKNCEIAVKGSNCGKNYHSSTGTIISPNYPNDYYNNCHCLYLIRVHGAKAIELNFTAFKTVKHQDYLLIDNGTLGSKPSQPIYLTGNSTETYTFYANEIWMEFVSNDKDTNAGWSCTYTSDFNACLCFNGGNCSNKVTKECNCASGWYGEHCEREIDECASTPCLNGGTCRHYNNHYNCSCASGWYGNNCESEDIDDCLGDNPCLNGGTCTDKRSGFECTCQRGYTGDKCEKEDTRCLTNLCQNGGTCYVYYYGFFCHCQPGYGGIRCDTDTNECSSQPCLNGGTCNDDINLYTCDCLSGWRGDNCEIKSSGDKETGYLMTMILQFIIMVLMIVAFIIFYKFYYLKNAKKGCETKMAKCEEPNEKVEMSTDNAYENEVEEVEGYISIEPHISVEPPPIEDAYYEVPQPPKKKGRRLLAYNNKKIKI